MSRIGYYDNAERRTTFRDLLKAYDVYGYRAMIMGQIDAKGTIVDQRGHGPGAIFVLKLDEPIMVVDYVDQLGLTVSGTNIATSVKAKAVVDDLIRLGFVESYLKPMTYENSRITHLWAQWKDVVLIDLQKGQPVEYVESESSHVASIKSTPGIVNKVMVPDHPAAEREIVELFLVHPVSWVRIPRSMDTDYLKPEHVSSWTDRMVVRSTYLNWKEKSQDTLPKGKVSDDGKEYVLDEPIALDDVKGMCSTSLTDAERVLRCWLGAAMFHIVPIVVGHSGTFRPMRIEVAQDSIPYIVTRKDIDDAMKRGEHFEQNPVYPAEWGPRPKFIMSQKVWYTDINGKSIMATICGIHQPGMHDQSDMDFRYDLFLETTQHEKYHVPEAKISPRSYGNNPIYPAEWEDSGSFDPSKFYKLPELKKDVLKDILSFSPKDLEVEPGSYSIWMDTIVTGRMGTKMAGVAAKVFGLGDVADYDQDNGDGSMTWDDYEFAWDVIDEYAEKIASWINENIGLPGKFHFGFHESDGDYGLEYVWDEGDHPEFDARG